jgi:hypothetical protein
MRAVAPNPPSAGLFERRANRKVGIEGGDFSDNEFSGEAGTCLSVLKID